MFPIFPFPPLEPSFTPKVFGGILEAATTPPRYALVRGRYTGKWSFPKGHRHPNEEPLVTALREVTEETGLQDLPTPLYSHRFGYGLYFLFPFETPAALDPQDQVEITETAWVTLDEMADLPINIDVNKFRKAELYRRAHPEGARKRGMGVIEIPPIPLEDVACEDRRDLR